MGLVTSPPSAPIASLSVRAFGAAGDGTTDDRAAILAAWAAAKTSGLDLYLPPGVYKISKYLDFADGNGVKIIAAGAKILYPSNDPSVNADTIAVSQTMARAGILLRYCRNVSIIGVSFEGADDPAFDQINRGVAIYATHCVGTRVTNCAARYGNALYVQDTQGVTTGTGDSLTVASSTVTLNDAAGLLRAGHVGARITVAGCADERNNGVFPIVAVPGSTSLQYTNPAAQAETSSFSWTIDDNDRDTVLEGCRSDGCRGSTYTCSDAVISNCHFSIPNTKDRVGHGASYSISGTTVTLYDPSGPFVSTLLTKYVKTSGSTSAGNDGTFKITSYVSAYKITYTNAAGVSEAIPAAATWWIMGGERMGIGAGVGALSKSGSTMTLTVASPMFSASDVNRVVRPKGATTAGNSGSFQILTVVSSTQITYTNANGASESYSGVVSVDSWDHFGSSGAAVGSSHAIYLFAGRSNIKIVDCTFRGVRTCPVKVSGSALPVRNIEVANCTAEDCGSFVVFGADDSQEHTGLNVHHNQLLDVGNGREGWCEGLIFQILGARNVQICNNNIHFSHDAIASVDGRSGGVGGFIGVNAARYIDGISQPLEDILIDGNTFTADPLTTRAAAVMATAIKLIDVGITARWNTGGTLTISGSTVTLTDANAEFPQELVGQSITLVNAPNAGNNGTFPITAVGNGSSTNQTTLQFTNASGVGGGVSAGTYRITPARGAGSAIVTKNEILHCATTGVICQTCVGPEVTGNVFSGLLDNVSFQGDATPRAASNRQLGAATQNAMLRLNAGTSWPIVHDNTITNQAIGTSSGRDWGIGVGNGTAVDFPLLGKTVRMLPTGAQEEVVVAYGSKHVDGDTITVAGVTYTYKTSAPSGSQFNSAAGLIALIAAQANMACTDYGAAFSAGAITTTHLRIRRSVTSTTDSNVTVTVSTLNPTALVLLRNSGGANASSQSRGSGSAPDKVVAWSPMARFSGVVTVAPDNTDARTVLQVNGPALPLKNGNNAGACELINVGDCTGKTPEFRAVFH
jgi:hypothetical protein